MSSEITAVEAVGIVRPAATRHRHPIAGVVLASIAASLLGGFWFCVAWAQRAGTPSNAVGVGLHILCVAILIATVTARGNWRGVREALLEHPKLYLSISILGGILSVVSVNGLGMSSLGSLGILSSTDILFTVVLGWLLFRERIRWASLLAIAAIVLGAGLRIGGGQAEASRDAKKVVAAQVQAGDSASDAQRKEASLRLRRLIGDSMFLAYAFLLSLNAFLIKRMLRHSGWEVILFGNMTGRLTLFLIFALLTGQAATGLGMFGRNPLTIAAVLGAGAFLSLQMSLYYKALHLAPVWVVKTFMMSAPVFYFLVDWVAFGTKPTWDVWFGSLLVLGGALWILLSDPVFRRQRTPDAHEFSTDHRGFS